jgi:hypothetical protein
MRSAAFYERMEEAVVGYDIISGPDWGKLSEPYLG